MNGGVAGAGAVGPLRGDGRQARSAASLPGADWPNRQDSEHVRAGGVDWHVQRAGRGEPWLLLHGTGSATHSWRGLLPRLAERHDVLAPDLPGHGWTTGGGGDILTLPGMAKAIGGLLRQLDFDPAVIVGHSAGAAVALRMALDGQAAPRHIVGINAALLPFGGSFAKALQPLTRAFAGASLLTRMVASRARKPGAVERLLEGTGSAVPPEVVQDYRTVLGRTGHVEATLRMMAGWDLETLQRDLARLDVPVTLLVGTADRTVQPAQARRVQRMHPGLDLRVETLDGLGHLAHEEDPERVAEAIERAVATVGAGGV